MITLTTIELIYVILISLLLGALTHAMVSGAVARWFSNLGEVVSLSSLPRKVRHALRSSPQSLPLHTHYNVRYKGALCGFLQLPAAECLREGPCAAGLGKLVKLVTVAPEVHTRQHPNPCPCSHCRDPHADASHRTHGRYTG